MRGRACSGFWTNLCILRALGQALLEEAAPLQHPEPLNQTMGCNCEPASAPDQHAAVVALAASAAVCTGCR